jgi:hypothetical protein
MELSVRRWNQQAKATFRDKKKSLTKNLKNSQALEPQTTQLTNQHLIRPGRRHFVQIIIQLKKRVILSGGALTGKPIRNSGKQENLPRFLLSVFFRRDFTSTRNTWLCIP